MIEKIGIVYSTVDGHTLKICNEIAASLQARGKVVEIFRLEDFHKKITGFDALIAPGFTPCNPFRVE